MDVAHDLAQVVEQVAVERTQKVIVSACSFVRLTCVGVTLARASPVWLETAPVTPNIHRGLLASRSGECGKLVCQTGFFFCFLSVVFLCWRAQLLYTLSDFFTSLKMKMSPELPSRSVWVVSGWNSSFEWTIPLGNRNRRTDFNFFCQ